MGAQKVEDLDVWRLCEEIRLLVTAKIAGMRTPKDHRFCNQILSAAEDAVADISEGFGRFRPREFAQFLGYGITSTAEVLQRTRFAHSRKYFDDDSAAKLIVLCVRADRAPRGLRKYLWTVAPEDVPYHAGTEPRRPRRRHRGHTDRGRA